MRLHGSVARLDVFRQVDGNGWRLVALLAAVVFAFPIWFMVTSAFKAEPEIQAIPVHWLPHQFQWLARFREAAINFERVLEELSFDAPDRTDKHVVIDEALVRQRLDALAQDEDLSRFIL